MQYELKSPLKEVMHMIDASDDPSASVTALIVILLTSLKSMDSSDLSDAIQRGFQVFEGGV